MREMLTERDLEVELMKEIQAKRGFPRDARYYNWKAKYGGMSISESKRSKELG